MHCGAFIEAIGVSRGEKLVCECGTGSGDDGSYLGFLIRPISIRPITMYTEFYDRGSTSRPNFF
jgi:hypothetical protein